MLWLVNRPRPKRSWCDRTAGGESTSYSCSILELVHFSVMVALQQVSCLTTTRVCDSLAFFSVTPVAYRQLGIDTQLDDCEGN